MLHKLFWTPFQTPAPAPTSTATTPATQNSKNTPTQKPPKKQQAHVEEKSEKQPSRFFKTVMLEILITFTVCILKLDALNMDGATTLSPWTLNLPTLCP